MTLATGSQFSLGAILYEMASGVRPLSAGNAAREPDTEKGQGHSHFHHASYNVASAYALLGRRADAVAWLEKTAAQGMPCYPLFEKDPYLDSLRKDPEFLAFLARVKMQWERFRASL